MIKVTVSVEDDATGRCAYQQFTAPTPIQPEQLYAAYLLAFQKILKQCALKARRRDRRPAA